MMCPAKARPKKVSVRLRRDFRRFRSASSTAWVHRCELSCDLAVAGGPMWARLRDRRCSSWPDHFGFQILTHLFSFFHRSIDLQILSYLGLGQEFVAQFQQHQVQVVFSFGHLSSLWLHARTIFEGDSQAVNRPLFGYFGSLSEVNWLPTWISLWDLFRFK